MDEQLGKNKETILNKSNIYTLVETGNNILLKRD